MNTLEAPVGTSVRPAFHRGLLFRHRDVSGKNRTGVVAEVTLFSNGWIAVAWLGDRPCVQLWPEMA